MSIQEITSRQNHYIKYTRSIKDRKTREIERAFVIEGKNSLKEAIGSGFSLRFFFITRTEFEKKQNRSLIDALIKSSQKSFLIDEKLMIYISDTINPSGFLAVMEARYQNIDDLQTGHDSLLLILDNIRDPGNLGTIFRVAFAFKTSGIILYGNTVDPYNPKAIRASTGMIMKIPFYFLSADEIDFLDTLKEKGVTIISTAPGASHSLLDHDLNPPLAFILGNESRGISDRLMAFTDYTIKIPMEKGIDSINVSIVAALLCYKFYEKNYLKQV